MAKTLIGNIKGKDGRGIASIEKTGTTGSVDTYTIRYTDGTTSTYTVNNSDSIALQRQIVPSAAVESSATASQTYASGDYVVVNGVLRKVKSAIAKGNAISDSNSTATNVMHEIGSGAQVGNFATHVQSNFSADQIIAKKMGKMRFLSFCLNVTGTAGENWQTFITVDAEDRPSVQNRYVGILYDGDYSAHEGYIDEDGNVKLYASLRGSGYIRGQLIWFVD